MSINNIIDHVYELTGLAIPVLLIGVPVLYWVFQKAAESGNLKNMVWIFLILYFAGFAIFQTNPFFIGAVVVLIALPVMKALFQK